MENLLPSSVFVNTKEPSSSHRREVLRSLRSSTFANMWHFFALANVIGCKVQSVYPDVQNPETNRSLLNIVVQPAAPALISNEPSVMLMWSHSSSTNKRGWGANQFVPLLPVGADALQEAEWVTEAGKRKREKRKAETPKVATSPSKKKPSNFHFPMNQPTSDFTQPSVQQGRAAEPKPKGAVLHREVTQEATSAVFPAKKYTSEEKKSSLPGR